MIQTTATNVVAPASIMVVDDQPANLKLMADMLKQQGYSVCSFPRGRMALTAARERPPDLILLDINMPEMDGFEVCERLKSDKSLASIPVIFLSALNEAEDKVKAFRAGGVDYVTKPFQFEEVQARVETHLALTSLQRELHLHADHLENDIRVVIQSSGRAIPAGSISRFFDVFAIGEAITVGGDDLGLGPPLASRILSLFGGSVTVENREPAGIQIQVTFSRDTPRKSSSSTSSDIAQEESEL